MEKISKSTEGSPNYRREVTLAEQFKRTETYQYGSTQVEVFDVKPNELKSDIPVFFGTGWSASRGVYEASILGLAAEGRRTLSVFAPHGIETDIDFGKGDKTYAAAELRKAAAMLAMLEQKCIDSFDIVAHSESAIWSLIVASMHPEKVRNIVLIDPAGIMDTESTARLATCFCLDIVQSALNEEKLPRPKIDRDVQPGSLADLFGALRNMFGRPLQSLKEVLAIRDADIKKLVAELKNMGKKIAIVQGKNDKVFPFERVKEFLGTESYDVAYPTNGTHNEINLNAPEYNLIIKHALDALEKLNMLEEMKEA